MNLLLKMAWLNIARNKRRTAILLCAMAAGLAGVLFSLAMINGWTEEMIDSAVRTFEGHVKVLAEGHQESPGVEGSVPVSPAARRALEEDPRVRAWAERIVAQGLLSTPRHARVVRIIGIDPAREAQVSDIRNALFDGSFLDLDEPGRILVGRRLADKIRVKPGKKVVLMAQQFGQDLGSAAFRIAGLFDTGVPGFDETYVYLLRGDAEELLNLRNRITETVVMLHDIGDSRAVAAGLSDTLHRDSMTALPWQQRMPLIHKYMQLTDKFMLPYYALFYVAMAFGIINTMSMAIGERKGEIGVLLALGMKRTRIVALLLLEAFLVAAVACVLGSLLGGGIVWWYAREGMDLSGFAEANEYMGIGNVVYPHLGLRGALSAGAAMVAVAALCSLLPAIRAARMVPVKALRTIR